MMSEDKQNRLRNRHQYMAGYRDGQRDMIGNPRLDPPWFDSPFYLEGYRDGQADEARRAPHRAVIAEYARRP